MTTANSSLVQASSAVSAPGTVRLGDILKHSRTLATSLDTDYLRGQAKLKGEEPYRKFLAVEAFFANAKKELSRQIQTGATKPEIVIGSAGVDDAKAVEALLQCGTFPSDLEGALKGTHHPYHCLWRDFQAWATSEGLIASLKSRHDGGGQASWHALVVQPAVSS